MTKSTKAKKTVTKTVVAKTNGKSTSTSKTAAALKLLRRPKGASREEILAVLGWAAISMAQLTAHTDGRLKTDKSARPFTYRLV
jgi:hypothetical protein